MVYPRPTADVDRVIAAVRTHQRAKRSARDRRDRDMLDALRDVERYEQQIADDDDTIEQLFVEREHATHPERFAPNTPAGPTP